MWYEIFPSMAIIFVGVSFPQLFAYYGNKLVHKGNPHKRTRREDFDATMVLRDRRLTGNEYKQQGLDGLS